MSALSSRTVVHDAVIVSADAMGLYRIDRRCQVSLPIARWGSVIAASSRPPGAHQARAPAATRPRQRTQPRSGRARRSTRWRGPAANGMTRLIPDSPVWTRVRRTRTAALLPGRRTGVAGSSARPQPKRRANQAELHPLLTATSSQPYGTLKPRPAPQPPIPGPEAVDPFTVAIHRSG